MERHEQEPPTDLDIMNDLQRTCDQLKAENEKLKETLSNLLSEIMENKKFAYYYLSWQVVDKAQQVLNEVTE